MTGSYGDPEFSTEIPDSALSEVSHSNHRPAYPPPLPPRRHHRGVGLARLGANLEAARPIWPRPSTPSLAHRPGRPHTSYRSEVPERRIGPDGDADGSWGITRGRVTMLRPKIGTARLSVLRSRYSPPVRPEGRLRPRERFSRIAGELRSRSAPKLYGAWLRDHTRPIVDLAARLTGFGASGTIAQWLEPTASKVADPLTLRYQ
jgi:hypothetical protein